MNAVQLSRNHIHFKLISRQAQAVRCCLFSAAESCFQTPIPVIDEPLWLVRAICRSTTHCTQEQGKYFTCRTYLQLSTATTALSSQHMTFRTNFCATLLLYCATNEMITLAGNNTKWTSKASPRRH